MSELRSLDQILSMPANGDFLMQFLADHAELITALQNHQMSHGGTAKGGFTIKVDYKLDRTLTMRMEATATFAAPKEPAASAAVWTTADGLLTPQNPKQMTFDLREASAPAQAIRT